MACGNDKKKAFLASPSARVKNRVIEIEKQKRDSQGTLNKTVFRARVVALPAQEAAGIQMSDGNPLDGMSDTAFQLKEGSFTMVNYIRVFGIDGALPDPAEVGISADLAVSAMAMHGPAYAPQYMNLKCGDIVAVQYEDVATTSLSSQIPKVISKFESDDAYADRIRKNLGKSTNIFMGIDSGSFLGNQFTINKNRAANLKGLVSVSGNKVYIDGPYKDGGLGTIFNKLMQDLQTFMSIEYAAIELKTDDLGAKRDLAAAAVANNPDRASGSKHGGAFAQDIYLHTNEKEGAGTYTSYKTQNPVLATNGKLVKAMRKFKKDWNSKNEQQMLWGGDFGFQGNPPGVDSADMASRGITEFHHWEIPGADIPKYLEKFEKQLRKVGIKKDQIKTITTTKKLAQLYTTILNYIGGR